MTRSSLRASLATPERKRHYVRRLFTTIADRYDLITRVLSYGLDASWKRRLARMGDAAPGHRTLDLACGTGDIAFALQARGHSVVGLDLTPRMIDLAVQRSRRSHDSRDLASAGSRGSPPPRPTAFLVGDMTALPFADASFDLVTTGYGLRNVSWIETAIDEIHRVLRPGGLVLSLDFDRPSRAPVRWVYLTYLSVVGGALGWLLHGDPDTYRYISESIRRYPGAWEVARLFDAAGFRDCSVVPLLGGLMAINTARRG